MKLKLDYYGLICPCCGYAFDGWDCAYCGYSKYGTYFNTIIYKNINK